MQLAVAAAALDVAAAARGRERSRRADEAADEEGAGTCEPVVVVPHANRHATIVPDAGRNLG